MRVAEESMSNLHISKKHLRLLVTDLSLLVPFLYADDEQEEETEAPTVTTTEQPTTSATTELPSATSSSLYNPSTTTDELATGVTSTTQRQPVTTPTESPTDLSGTVQRETEDGSSPTQSMPSGKLFKLLVPMYTIMLFPVHACACNGIFFGV